MRILKGYSKDEQKELEEAKDNGFSSVITLIYGIGEGYSDCRALSEKYCREDNDNDQLAKDIVDFYCGNAIFPEEKYVVHDKATDQYVYCGMTQWSLCWGQFEAVMPDEKTKEEWLEINPAYEPMLEKVEDDE